jgi:hypothetical protein
MRNERSLVWIIAALCLAAEARAAAEAPWPAVTLAPAAEVRLSGPLGDALARGVARLAQPPFDEKWLRSDVSFEQARIFTNYSGDASGRFLELAALTSPPGQLSPAALGPLAKSIARWQKPDGHFGADVDLSKKLDKNAPPIPMLWGNGRLLVGLVTAAERLHDDGLMQAARRLGDYYVNTAEQLCSPAREAEYKASGTYGEGYTCCYFPGIEGLALLYRSTHDERYLKQARRMADFFLRFDALPIDHSHGNLCAWRGILELYGITKDAGDLERARAKWDAAMRGGFVWPTGGIGEHWYTNFEGDEGCSESDWLRFSLDLWRYTGETRYLDVAERLLENQYPMNQCPNGGYGMRHFDGEAAGPDAARSQLEEWPFCCSFHGPLGLHFLKGYLATGSERGVFVNFPLDFTAPVVAGGRRWLVTAHSKPEFLQGRSRLEIELAPTDEAGKTQAGAARTTLWLRMPNWASGPRLMARGEVLPAPLEHGYLRIEREFSAGEKLTVDFQTWLAAEGRRFQPQQVAPKKVSRLRDVAVLCGPEVLFATPAGSAGRPVLLATVDAAGHLGFPAKQEGGYATVALSGPDVPEEQITAALTSGRVAFLRPWPSLVSGGLAGGNFHSVLAMNDIGPRGGRPPRRMAFMCDLVVVPAESLPAAELKRFATRAAEAAKPQAAQPHFGEDLEKHRDFWEEQPGWKFTPEGLLVAGGDVGLLEGQGYRDYRLEFELVLPKEGQGIAGWIVRAASEDECLMFQLQSADSTFEAPQFKTRPNTLRPHQRRGGQWQVGEPVALPKEVRRGEVHHIAVACRGDTIEVFLDGQRIHTQKDGGLRTGTIGFRASGPGEQGLFRRISLKQELAGDGTAAPKVAAGDGNGAGFGGRGSGHRKAMLARYGGSLYSERAVTGALVWLANHQLVDGSWNLQRYTTRCRDATCTGQGQVTADAGATAMSLLPFLAAGQTHKTKGPYRGNIANALNWLIRQQTPDGNLAKNCVQPMYSHGLATTALCEAYGLSGDKIVGMAAQGAINYIINAQNKNDGGWRYNPGDAGDTSVLGWQVMALKSARMAGLNVGGATFSGASKWLDSVQSGPANSLYGYQPGQGHSNSMTAVGLLCRQYLGAKRSDPMMVEGVKYLLGNLPEAELPNIYYWYYAGQVMHNMSGYEWDQWNRRMRKILVDSQCKDASTCANGSWNPSGDLWGSRGGRLMQTAFSALMLEIYYRYLPLYKSDEGEAGGGGAPDRTLAATALAAARLADIPAAQEALAKYNKAKAIKDLRERDEAMKAVRAALEEVRAGLARAKAAGEEALAKAPAGDSDRPRLAAEAQNGRLRVAVADFYIGLTYPRKAAERATSMEAAAKQFYDIDQADREPLTFWGLTARYFTGRCQEGQGKLADAKEIYEEVLVLDTRRPPDSALAGPANPKAVPGPEATTALDDLLAEAQQHYLECLSAVQPKAYYREAMQWRTEHKALEKLDAYQAISLGLAQALLRLQGAEVIRQQAVARASEILGRMAEVPGPYQKEAMELLAGLSGRP